MAGYRRDDSQDSRRDRDGDRDRGDRGERDGYGGRGGAGRQRRGRRFTDLKLYEIDYRNERLLRKFISERGKLLPRRTTGISALFQRRLTRAVKRARHLALLPFVAETYK
jgi:small subunit ribosomal protein S18